MTPQMIKTLAYFMVAVIFKEGFESVDMEKAKNISSVVIMIMAFKLIYLIYWQLKYLG